MICRKKILSGLILLFFLGLNGCVATHTAISKRDLDVQTKMSKTIFLDPVAEDKKTVFVQVRNTSGNPNFDLQRSLNWELNNRGYTIVNNPDEAQFMVQTNVLQVGKANLNEVDSVLDSGFGGGLLGAAITGASGGGSRAVVGGGLAGAALGVALDAMTKDICYTVVTDVQISERTHATVKEKVNSHLSQGTHSNRVVTSTENSHWKRYQTRIVSSANKVNLQLEEAMPELAYGISNSIAGIL